MANFNSDFNPVFNCPLLPEFVHWPLDMYLDDDEFRAGYPFSPVPEVESNDNLESHNSSSTPDSDVLQSNNSEHNVCSSTTKGNDQLADSSSEQQVRIELQKNIFSKEENVGSTGRSYTGFKKSLLTGNRTISTTGVNPSTSTRIGQSSLMIPTEKLTELDVKGIKRMKELSHVVCSDERSKLDIVSLKPDSVELKVISLSSSTLASLRGTATDEKFKPNYYSKKSKYKDDSNVQSPTLSSSTRTSLSQGHLKTSRITSSVLSEAVLKCDKCGQSIECIGYCIIVCGTLIHREPAITAPLLMDIIET
ncbi:unnamed protein product, partial [Rotaria sordida]